MRTQGLLRKILSCSVVFAFSLQSWPMAPQIVIPTTASSPRTAARLPGQSVTLLPDGNWLLLGGEGKNGPVATASVNNSKTGTTVTLPHGLGFARAWHTATVLPDGTVLVLGGVGGDGRVLEGAEILDWQSMTFRPLATGLIPRAHHAASLLTDGELVVAGGLGRDGDLVLPVETWNPSSGKATVLESPLPNGRRDDRSLLLSDGTLLLWGGADDQGNLLTFSDIYDPDLRRFVPTTSVESSGPDWNILF